MEFKIPRPLTLEHEELHAELQKATKARGQIGEAAKAVAKILHPHFVREEQYALPPLGLLTLLAKGEFNEEMKEVLKMPDRLDAELPQMLEEHKAIVAALEDLSKVAQRAKKPQYSKFAQKLIQHAQMEEEILYPASMLIGEYLELRFQL
jgi:hypothetical protein